MSRRNTVLGFLLLSSALVITAVFILAGRTASGQSSPGDNPVAQINEKAALLNTGDETQIRQLADEIFKAFEMDQVPLGMTDSLKDRLVRAEVNYRTGRGKPVSEFGVVRMTNMLMDKLGAPAYAKTNVFELRRLEMIILPQFSKLIGNKPVGQNRGPKALGSSINPMMSPLEAFTMAGQLIQQKRFDPEFQVTQDEWLAKHMAKGKGKDGGLPPGQDKKRSEELEQAITGAANSMSAADLVKLSQQALDKLGVPRLEGGTGQ